MGKTVPIRVPPELRDRIKLLERPHQSLARVIEELVTEAEDKRIDYTEIKQ